LLPRQYHRWIGVKGTGPVMLFEVSTTNDDTLDNRFHTAKGRLPDIEEDAVPEYLLFKDYRNYVNFK
jgi:D-lyxose ketol-isomerase